MSGLEGGKPLETKRDEQTRLKGWVLRWPLYAAVRYAIAVSLNWTEHSRLSAAKHSLAGTKTLRTTAIAVRGVVLVERTHVNGTWSEILCKGERPWPPKPF